MRIDSKRKQDVAYSAGVDAANKQMRKEGRHNWSLRDYLLASSTMHKILDELDTEEQLERGLHED